MSSSFTSRKKSSGKAGTSDVTDTMQSATIRRRKWLQSLSTEKRDELRQKDRLRKQQQRARKRENQHEHMQDATTPPAGGSSKDIAMDTDFFEKESDGPAMDTSRSGHYRPSKLVRFDSPESDAEHADFAFAPESESRHIESIHTQMDYTTNGTKDLTVGIIGRKVPAQSATVQWHDGRITVLPTIVKKGVNIFQHGDVEVVKYFASFPESTPSSEYVLHLSTADMERQEIVEIIECALRDNKPVVVRGNRANTTTEMTTEWLDRKFGINPDMPVSIHGELSINIAVNAIRRAIQMQKRVFQILCILTRLAQYLPLSQVSMTQPKYNASWTCHMYTEASQSP
jgi:hypothetical protein